MSAGMEPQADDPLLSAARGRERLADLALRLLAPDRAELSQVLQEGVALAGEMAGADRCVLLAPGHPSPWVPERCDWCRPGGPLPCPAVPEAAHARPWAREKLLRGEALVVPDVGVLPEEARAERDGLRSRGVGSSLVLPVRFGRRGLAFLMWERRSPGDWLGILVARLESAAALLAGVLHRALTEAQLERQIRLEQRLSELSRHVLHLGPGDHQQAVDLGLRVALEVSGVDRVYLIEIEGREASLEHIHEVTAPGIPPATPEIRHAETGRFRWASSLFLTGEPVRIENPEDLPAEARSEREDLSRRGVLSLLGIPVRAGRATLGYLAFECLRWPRIWGDREVDRLRLVAETLAGAIRRQRAERELMAQIEAEKRVAHLSRHLLSIQPGEIPEAIDRTLAQAAALARVDRSFLYTSRAATTGFEYYEWCAEGIASEEPERDAWATSVVLRGEVVMLGPLDEAPPEAEALCRKLRSRGVQALLCVPVFSDRRLIGVMGFESLSGVRHWSDHDVTLLRLLGEILSGALHRGDTEAALQHSESQLLQSQKMEAVGRLAGGIAHDFNNLLTVILGFSRALLADLSEDDPARQDLGEIHDAADRAAALTRQLLTFSRRQHIQRKPVDLALTCRSLASMLERLLGEDVELVLEGESLGCWSEGDPHQLEQILVNLAVNARDAMPDGGTLSIGTRNETLDRKQAQERGLAGPGSWIALWVADTGHGLDPAAREQIFEPFFTTKEPGQGTGLGLSIVYSIVQQWGGAIEVESSPGKGTRFRIWLPGCDETGDLEAPEGAFDREGRGGRVLLVEDESAVRRLTRRILERHGYRVVEACDGQEALERAESLDAGPDLLVTDVVMPRLGGVELAQRLRARFPALQVLFVSGYPRDFPAPGETASERVKGPFLYKPFTADELLRRVSVLLDPEPVAGGSGRLR